MASSKQRIGIAGLGTVGCAVADALLDGILPHVELTHIAAKNHDKSRSIDAARLEGLWVASPHALICDEVDIIVEVIGGEDGIAYELVNDALRAGKSVVTANKALLAKHGGALAKTAQTHHASLGFEAAVAGGIPIIKMIREALIGNRILSVCGILNGTCNYILTRMEADGSDFAAALKEAQRLGFAETPPDLDVDGTDTAQKLALLTSLAFGRRLDTGAISPMGVRKITTIDMAAAQEFGYVIRLLGITSEAGVQEVSPMLVSKSHILANVDDVSNAVLVNAAPLGEIFIRGAGAGGGATASAVLADISDIAAGFGRDVFGRPSDTLAAPQPRCDAAPRNWYLRLNLEDKPGKMAEVTQIIAKHDVSIKHVVQDARDDGKVPCLFMTHCAKDKDIIAMRQELADEFLPPHDIMMIPVFGEVE